MMSLWDALRMNMMISYQELVRTFLRRNVKWLSFFIFISILSLFRGWSFIKQFHLSAFTVLAVFIYALYSYIRISTFVNKMELNNKFIVFLRLKKFVLFFKQGAVMTPTY
ncbi:hypothetical protein HmCms171_02331 [Escherichia coli]|nr:hypothetical protein HmCms171_02331 [Escherichia coli]